jgi:ABC-2 type transport system ATP-binding protein
MSMSASVTLAVEVEGVSKSFRSREGRRLVPHAALDAVNLAVRSGELVALVGLNGSGKSTLIRVIATLTTPDRGRVRVFGHDAQRESRLVRRRINRVSVEASFFKEMSAWENLSYAGRLYGRRGPGVRDDALGVLRRLGLSRTALDRPMKQLSRGQQQKVAIARSALSAPSLLLMDEPTTGLDPRSKREVQAFVRELHGDGGVTVLLSTHDLVEVEALCRRIVVIDRGRIVADASPEALRRDVAGSPSASLEDAFLHLTGRSFEEDVDEDPSLLSAALAASGDSR